MWQLSHPDLNALLIVLLLSALPLSLVLSKYYPIITKKHHVAVIMLIWLAVATFEYYFLGPNSFISIVSDSYFLAFRAFVAMLDAGTKFSHVMGGGQDASMIVSSGTFVLPDVMMMRFFDPWIVLFFHKAMILTLGLVGSYLLARHVTKQMDADNGRFIAFSAATLFPFSHVYLIDYTVEFGFGFSAIPLAVYGLLSSSRKYSHRIIWLLLTMVLMAFAQPMKVLPAFAVATLATTVLFNHQRWFMLGLSFVVCAIIAVLNWAETINGISLLSQYTARGANSETMHNVRDGVFAAAIVKFLSMRVVLAAILIATLTMFVTKNSFRFRAIFAVLTLLVSYLALNVIPWEWLNLGIINKVEHGYTLIAVNVIAIPILAAAIAGCRNWTLGAFKVSTAHLALSLGLISLVGVKIFHAAYLIALGGQASVFGYKDLQQLQLPSTPLTRVVTLMDNPHPGVMSGIYGFASFDGNIILNIKSWNDYWHAVHRRSDYDVRALTRPSLDWKYWDGREYAVEKQLDMELLRRANVGYVISALPLMASTLENLVSVEKSSWPRRPRSEFPSFGAYLQDRVERITDPGQHHVYALKHPIPRIRPARRFIVVPDDAPSKSLLATLRGVKDDVAVVYQADAPGLNVTSELSVTSINQVKNGYDIHIQTQEAGLLIVNNVYLPFWQARVDGLRSKIVPVNLIEMGVFIPKGAQELQLRYKRPDLLERLQQ
tara:strand:- start:8273 stop:10420 length:2148 start_codon:yes stop_codon:yes gene_type:complete